MAAYPATLPAPQYPGYGLNPADALARSDVEQGPARQRRRYTAIPYMIPVAFMYTDAQFLMFEDFWRDTLHHGNDYFDMALRDGNGTATKTVRFTAPWQATALGHDLWNITATLERRA